MTSWVSRPFAFVLMLVVQIPLLAAEAAPVGVFVFADDGFHAEARPEESVLMTLAKAARETGHEIAVSGVTGSPEALARNLPATAAWSLPDTPPSLTASFRRSEIDHVVLALPKGWSKADPVMRLLDWVGTQRPRAKLHVLNADQPLAAEIAARFRARERLAFAPAPQSAAEFLAVLLPDARPAAQPSAMATPIIDAPQPVTLPPELARPSLTSPALAMGLNGVTDWTVAQPFLDVMKTARPWIGHLPGQWGGTSFEEMRAEGVFDPQGWPRQIPAAVEALETLILTDLPDNAGAVAGRYRVAWKGKGRLQLTGRAENIRDGKAGEIWFDFRPGPGAVGLKLLATDPADPLRDITVLRADRIALHDLGVAFNPDWILRIRDLRLLRFMDWMQTNNSPIAQWHERPLPSDFSYSWRGVPAEVMVELANLVGADPWFTMPHRADDAFITEFARLVKRDLRPNLQAHVEWSNEVWNFIFEQAHWAVAEAKARWKTEGGDGWMQFAGLRASQVARLWRETFTENPERLVTILGVHTGWLGLEAAALDAPLARAEGHPRPAEAFDGYAVTGYFGHGIASPEQSAELRGWIDAGTATEEVTRYLRDVDIPRLIDEAFAHHARVAEREGLRLMMYEGGSHLTAQGPAIDDAAVTNFLSAFSYSPEMASLYEQLLDGWQRQGGEAFNAFVEIASPSRWGSWGARRDLGDENPRAAMLDAWNAATAPEWQSRPHESFAATLWQSGTSGDDELEVAEGTTAILLTGAGDDLISVAGSAQIDGGEGHDIVTLTGRREEWQNQNVGAVQIYTQGTLVVYLNNVEEVRFSH